MDARRVLYYYYLVLYFSVDYGLCQSVAYDIVSRTTAGEPCINTCTSNGTCYVDHRLNTRPCMRDVNAGVPGYHTTLDRGSHARCLSNCGPFGGPYWINWCYTTENYDWDYCNSNVSNEVKKSHVSKRSPVLDRIFAPERCTPGTRRLIRYGSDGEVERRISRALTGETYRGNIQISNSFPAGSPYTFVATASGTNANGDRVLMPLVVRARLPRPSPITRSSKDVPRDAFNNVGRMYDSNRAGIDTGHIIAFANGGTPDLFNFVGQTEAVNNGPYKILERFVMDWINTLGYAVMSVVIDYVGTRPREFAVKLKLYNHDGSLHSDCLDVIIKND